MKKGFIFKIKKGFIVHTLADTGSWHQMHLLHVQQPCPMSNLLKSTTPPHGPHMDALFVYDYEQYQEYLLCFSKFGVYVTYDGKRARQSELMWPSQVTI